MIGASAPALLLLALTTPAAPVLHAMEGNHSSTGAEWWVAFWTFCLFIATSGLWLFTALMWWATRKAVNENREGIRAAKASADAAVKLAETAQAANAIHAAALEAEYRPILFVGLELADPLTWSDGALKTKVKVTVSNHGKFPARVVREEVRAIVAVGFPSRQDPREEQEKLLGRDTLHQINAETQIGGVFADEPYVFLQELTVPADEFRNAVNNQYGMSIIGVIAYEAFTARGSVYQSAFMWNVVKVQKNAGLMKRLQLIVGEDVPNDSLITLKSSFGNFDRTMRENEVLRVEGAWKPPFKPS